MQKVVSPKDRYDLPISTNSSEAAERFQEGVDRLLTQNFGPEESLQQSIEADEGFAMAHAELAYTWMLRVQPVEAKESMQRAQSLAAGVTRREAQHIECIALFVAGNGTQSLAMIREHLAEFPRDALRSRLAQRHFMQGCSSGVANFPEELFAMLTELEPHYGDDWSFLGQYAFAHHETGRLDKAYQLAQRSLDLCPTNAVASHSVTHVFFERGDPIGGGDFLGNWLTTFDKRAAYHIHLSWHQALFELALGRYQQAIGLYETDIRPSVVAKSAGSLADSASLMWRMQVYSGVAPTFPWEEVRDQAAPAADRPGPPFRDAHAARAFAAVGDDEALGRMMDGLREIAHKGNAVAEEVTLPLVQGIYSFSQRDYLQAVQSMEPIVGQLTRLGGSHAQREVFEDTLLEAYLRAEQFDKAEDMLRARLKQRASVRDTFWLGRTQASRGEAEAAGASLREATEWWQSADQRSAELVSLNRLADAVG